MEHAGAAAGLEHQRSAGRGGVDHPQQRQQAIALKAEAVWGSAGDGACQHQVAGQIGRVDAGGRQLVFLGIAQIGSQRNGGGATGKVQPAAAVEDALQHDAVATELEAALGGVDSGADGAAQLTALSPQACCRLAVQHQASRLLELQLVGREQVQAVAAALEQTLEADAPVAAEGTTMGQGQAGVGEAAAAIGGIGNRQIALIVKEQPSGDHRPRQAMDTGGDRGITLAEAGEAIEHQAAGKNQRCRGIRRRAEAGAAEPELGVAATGVEDLHLLIRTHRPQGHQPIGAAAEATAGLQAAAGLHQQGRHRRTDLAIGLQQQTVGLEIRQRIGHLTAEAAAIAEAPGAGEREIADGPQRAEGQIARAADGCIAGAGEIEGGNPSQLHQQRPVVLADGARGGAQL